MDGLALKITQGNRVALNLVRTYVTTPTLINLDITQGDLYAIPLECETQQKTGNAEVSESLVITSNQKQNVADNVAPGSWTWDLTGYIPGSKAMEPTNYYTPIVRLNTDVLERWFKRGAVLVFKDGNAQTHKRVVIKSLTTSQSKDCKNKTPFKMTLKEINVMENAVLNTFQRMVEKFSKSEAGSALGQAAAFGTTIATVASVFKLR